MESVSRRIFAFEGFHLDPAARRLTGPDGAAVELKPRVFDALVALVERAGEVVDKQALMDAVWPGVVVEENNLNQAVSALRRALGDDRDNPRFIATIPGRGYQFVAPVSAPAADPIPGGGQAVAPQDASSGGGRFRGLLSRRASESRIVNLAANPVLWVGGILFLAALSAALIFSRGGSGPVTDASIAVLPFENVGGDPEQDYFARGVAIEILDILGRFEGLHVIDRNSSFAFGPNADVREVRGRTSVANVLTGAVRREGGDVLINVELVDAATARVIWSERYSGPLTTSEITAVQRDIARRIAGALSATFSIEAANEIDGAGTDLLEAYEAYLRGRDSLSSGDIAAAEASFRTAVALDPDYAPAWSQLGFAVAASTRFEADPHAARARQDEAFGYTARALELAPGSVEAQASYGVVIQTQYDWVTSEDVLSRSFEVARHERVYNNMKMLHLRVGRIQSSYGYSTTQDALTPLSTLDSHIFVSMLADPETAREELEPWAERVRSGPWDPDRTAFLLTAYVGQGDAAGVRQTLEYVAARSDAGPSQMAQSLLDVFDDSEAARDVLMQWYEDDEIPNAFKWYLVPIMAAWYGDADLVLRVWRDELPVNQYRLNIVWADAFSAARETPEFVALARDLGLERYWREVAWADTCRPLDEAEFVCN